MLEIFFLISFGRALSKTAATKGRSKAWAALGVAFWLGGEIFGFILGGLLGLETLPCYGIAIALAICGAGVAWVIVKSLPDTGGGAYSGMS